jgi:AraC family transcriptional regulator
MLMNREDKCLNRISAWTTSYEGGARLGLHARREAYLSIVLRGSYDEHLGSRVVAGLPLRLRYHAPHEEHAHVFGAAGGRCLNIEVGAGWSEVISELDKRATSPIIIDAIDFRVVGLALAARDTLEMESAAAELLSLCGEQVRVERAAERNAAIRKAFDYIEETLSHTITLTELAKLVELHPTHFARSFRSNTGLTVGQYVRRRRVAKAQQMLASSNDMGISRIAAASGFADHAHMTRTFRDLMGVAPSEYRGFRQP